MRQEKGRIHIVTGNGRQKVLRLHPLIQKQLIQTKYASKKKNGSERGDRG